MLKNRNYDNDSDKLHVLQKRLISQKYKKCSPGKYALVLYVAVSIRWIYIRFDFTFFKRFIYFVIYTLFLSFFFDNCHLQNNKYNTLTWLRCLYSQKIDT